LRDGRVVAWTLPFFVAAVIVDAPTVVQLSKAVFYPNDFGNGMEFGIWV
jgi:hypothetical protein